MNVKIISSEETEKTLIGILCIKNNKAFLNYVTPFHLLHENFDVMSLHNEVNEIVKLSKDYCKKQKLKLIQY